MISENKIDDLKRLQALRMSGVLYLLGEVTGCPVFDKENYDYNKTMLLESVLNHTLPKDFLARLIFYKNKNDREQMNYAEGLFYDLYLKLKDENISKIVFLEEIEKVFVKELSFLKKINNNGKIKFNFPTDEGGLCTSKVIKKIKKENNSSLRLTAKRKKRWFGQRKALYLNECEKSEGIFLTGYCGSGVTLAALSMFSQVLIKGGGGLYFTQDHRPHWEIVSCLKSIGREDDVFIYNIHTFDDFLKLDMANIVKHNKVVIFILQMLSLEKDPYSEELKDFISQLHQFLFLKFQEVEPLVSTKNFIIAFDGLMSLLMSDNKEMFHVLNDLLKNKGILKVYQEKDTKYAGENLSFIKHYLLMKQENYHSNLASGGASRDLRCLQPGEFFYTKDFENVSENDFHVFLFISFKDVDNLYLNVF